MQTTSGCRKKITLWGWYELDYKTGKHKLDVSPIHEHEHPCSHPGHRSLHHLPLRSFVSASISFTTTDFLDTLRILRHHPQDVHMCLSSLWSPLLLRLSCLAPLLPSILKNLSSQLFLPWIIPMFSTSLPYFAFPCTFPFLHILLLHLICLSSTSRTRAEFFFFTYFHGTSNLRSAWHLVRAWQLFVEWTDTYKSIEQNVSMTNSATY